MHYVIETCCFRREHEANFFSLGLSVCAGHFLGPISCAHTQNKTKNSARSNLFDASRMRFFAIFVIVVVVVIESHAHSPISLLMKRRHFKTVCRAAETYLKCSRQQLSTVGAKFVRERMIMA